MKLIKYFNIPDLLLLAVGMLTLKVGFLDQQPGALQALNLGEYLLLVLATVFVAAGGFFMNNVFGFGKDANPEVTESKGYNIYFALNIIGIGIVYYLANSLGKPMLLTGLYVFAAATMYFYATSLKEMLVANNVITAVLTALPVITVGLFQLFPILGIVPEDAKPMVSMLFTLFIDYSVFTFFVALALGIINDIATTDADYNAGVNTLPILIGRERSAKIAIGLTAIPVVLFVYYADKYLLQLIYALAYGVVFIVGLLAYSIIRLLQAKSAKDFTHIAGVVKLVLLFVAFFSVVLTYNINHVK